MAYEQKFTADGAQAQKELDKLAAAVDKLTARNKELAIASGQYAKQNQSALAGISGQLSKHTGELAGMITQYATVTAAVGAVVGVYHKWSEEMNRVGESYTKMRGALAKEIVIAGDVFEIEKVTDELDKIKDVPKQQKTEAYAGVKAGLPQASVEDRLALTKEVAKYAMMGLDMKDIGRRAGELQDVTGMKPDDVADMLFAMMEKAGGDSEKLKDSAFTEAIKRLEKTGAVKSFDEAASVGVAALNAGLDGKSLNKLIGAITETVEVVKPKYLGGGIRKPLTEEQKATNIFAKADAVERLRLLREDRATQDKFLGDQREKLGSIDWGTVPKMAGEFKAARETDYGERMRQEFKRMMPDVSGGIETAGLKETSEQLDGMLVAQGKEARDRIIAVLGEKGANSIVKMWAGLQLDVQRTMAKATDKETPAEQVLAHAEKMGIPKEKIEEIRQEQKPQTEIIQKKRASIEVKPPEVSRDRVQEVKEELHQLTPAGVMEDRRVKQEALRQQRENPPELPRDRWQELKDLGRQFTPSGFMEDRRAKQAALRQQRELPQMLGNIPEIPFADLGERERNVTPEQAAASYRNPPQEVVDRIPQREPEPTVPILRDILGELKRANDRANPGRVAAPAIAPAMAGPARREQAQEVP